MVLGAERLPRVLGRFGPVDGTTTLIVVAGLHGNEPAGVEAARRIRNALLASPLPLVGELVLLLGNVSALERGERFLTRDLNRAWTPRQVGALRTDVESSSEDREQRELLDALEGVLDEASGPVHLLDLHTTSGSGGAFSTVSDTLKNRALALALPVPMVLGLEELVEGTLHDYMGNRGVINVAFEAGQHEDPRSIDRAEAAIWLMMAATGVARAGDLPAHDPSRALLSGDSRGLPRAVEMRYRHPIAPEDGFRMLPGYRNFQPIRRGEAVAGDRHGPVTSPETARILMPLYQVRGNDGFFVVREFSPAWLRVSGAARRLKLDRWVHWLPGIRRMEGDPDALVVDRRVARWYALQVLHLLGFRREVEVGRTLVVHRRPEA
ncbi:MAG TPA: succinylglutamate desuccinylase/aspartoacylase family protein [Longimicrobiales bacterium]|nr:succinylglutamate desuccinylase/aspartoacylase family protein [Longimicrobiales bacterium]